MGRSFGAGPSTIRVMPDVTWDQATYDAAYQRRDPLTGIYLPSYRRNALGSDLQVWRDRVQQISDKLSGRGFTPQATVLIVGCGFGWTIERAMTEFNISNIWGVDTSPFIQSQKALHATPTVAARILNIDVTDPNARTLLQTAGAGRQTGPPGERGKSDWVITELVMESIDPANRTAFLNALDGLATGAGRVVHLVAAKEPGDQPFDPTLGMQSLTLAQWVAVRPAHTWIDVENGRWIVGGA